MRLLFSLVVWPLGAVAIHFLQPLAFPGEPPPPAWLLASVAGLGMAASIYAAVLRAMGYLRDDKARRFRDRPDGDDA